MAIVTENVAGRWPFWLCPTQATIVPVNDTHLEYANVVAAALRSNGYRVEVDENSASLGKKIRAAQLEQSYYMLVVGDEEVNSRVVDVRVRDGTNLGKLDCQGILDEMASQERLVNETSTF